MVLFLNFRYSLYYPQILLIGRKTSKYVYKWLFYQDFNLNLIFSKKPFIYNAFTQFYLIPQESILKKSEIKLNLLKFKQQIAFLKKRDNVKRILLFRANSRFIPQTTLVDFEDHFIENEIEFKESLPYLNTKNLTEYFYYFQRKFLTQNQTQKTINVKNKFNRIFFENRKIFTTVSNYQNLRQKQFTNLFSAFFKKYFLKTILAFEFNLVNILLKSRFFFSKNQAQFAIQNSCIFVNGVLVEKNIFIKVGDRIQLIINPAYYHIHKSSVIYSSKFQKKISQHI